MDSNLKTEFFLGSNTAQGFYSLYDNFTDSAAGDFLWIIKGGPGCGKSSFIKKISDAALMAGMPVEYIHCSGDPDSADGVYLPTLKAGYVDGTSPHTADATYPAASEMYLDIGQFYDHNALRPYLPQIHQLNADYKSLYARAYELLSAAGGADIRNLPMLVAPSEKAAAARRADGIIIREFGKREAETTTTGKQRFLSAFTCKGIVSMYDNIYKTYDRIYAFDDMYGLADVALRRIYSAACRRGINVIVCRDPVLPERIQAVLVPEQSLAFLSVTPPHEADVYRHIRLDALIDRDRLSDHRIEVRRSARLHRDLLDEAQRSLAQAKRLHDELEAIYNPHVDFAGVYALAGLHIVGLLI